MEMAFIVVITYPFTFHPLPFFCTFAPVNKK